MPLWNCFQWELRCEYLPALYWLSSTRRVRLARKDKRAGVVDAFLRERNNALEQLLDCLHMEAGRGAENVRGPALGGIGSALQK